MHAYGFTHIHMEWELTLWSEGDNSMVISVLCNQFLFSVLLLGTIDKTKGGMHTSLPLSSPNYKHIQLITPKSRFHLCERWECKAVRQEKWHTLIHKKEINISHTLASYVGTRIFTLDWWWFDFRLKEVVWGTCACTAHCVFPSVHTAERQMNIPFIMCVNRVMRAT